MCRLAVIAWLILGYGASLFAQASAARVEAPVGAALAEATRALTDIYKKEYEAAKTPLEKQVLVEKMLSDAAKTNDDPASRYALLKIARKIATANNDADRALQAVELTVTHYELDSAALRKESIAELAQAMKTPAEQYNLTRYILRLQPTLFKAGQYIVAADLAETAVACARKSGDNDLVKQWTRRKKELDEMASAAKETESAFAILEKNPTDPAASTLAGKYLCFIHQDWDRGLSMLALGEESDVQQLAAAELQGFEKAEQELALADRWYDLAQTMDGPRKAAILRHAAQHYRKRLAGLSAIAQRRVQNRIDEAALTSQPLLVKDEWIEILDLFDLDKRPANGGWYRDGGWVREGTSLTSDGRGSNYIAIPVAVTGSYEIEVTYTKQKGWENLNLSLSEPANNAYFQINSRGEMSGIARIDGREQPNQSADWRVPNYPWVNGRPYRVKVTVLREKDQVAIAADVNGKRYFRWTGPESQLTEADISPSPKKLEGRFVLGGGDTALTIHSVRLKTKGAPPKFLE